MKKYFTILIFCLASCSGIHKKKCESRWTNVFASEWVNSKDLKIKRALYTDYVLNSPDEIKKSNGYYLFSLLQVIDENEKKNLEDAKKIELILSKKNSNINISRVYPGVLESQEKINDKIWKKFETYYVIPLKYLQSDYKFYAQFESEKIPLSYQPLEITETNIEYNHTGPDPEWVLEKMQLNYCRFQEPE